MLLLIMGTPIFDRTDRRTDGVLVTNIRTVMGLAVHDTLLATTRITRILQGLFFVFRTNKLATTNMTNTELLLREQYCCCLRQSVQCCVAGEQIHLFQIYHDRQINHRLLC